LFSGSSKRSSLESMADVESCIYDGEDGGLIFDIYHRRRSRGRLHILLSIFISLNYIVQNLIDEKKSNHQTVNFEKYFLAKLVFYRYLYIILYIFLMKCTCLHENKNIYILYFLCNSVQHHFQQYFS
jgi:hypothetical protein